MRTLPDTSKATTRNSTVSHKTRVTRKTKQHAVRKQDGSTKDIVGLEAREFKGDHETRETEGSIVWQYSHEPGIDSHHSYYTLVLLIYFSYPSPSSPYFTCLRSSPSSLRPRLVTSHRMSKLIRRTVTGLLASVMLRFVLCNVVGNVVDRRAAK